MEHEGYRQLKSSVEASDSFVISFFDTFCRSSMPQQSLICSRLGRILAQPYPLLMLEPRTMMKVLPLRTRRGVKRRRRRPFFTYARRSVAMWWLKKPFDNSGIRCLTTRLEIGTSTGMTLTAPPLNKLPNWCPISALIISLECTNLLGRTTCAETLCECTRSFLLITTSSPRHGFFLKRWMTSGHSLIRKRITRLLLWSQWTCARARASSWSGVSRIWTSSKEIST